MNFLDNTPSENRTKFTKLKVACKYASIGGGLRISLIYSVLQNSTSQKELFSTLKDSFFEQF